MFELPGNIDRFSDANTYLAAGERLNDGHALYHLGPGDRQVLIDPQFFNTPLVSPPTIAVIWRPLAALPFGFWVWLVGCWLALLGTVAVLVWRMRLIGAAVCIAMAEPIGNQMALGNLSAFLPLLFVIAWDQRRHPWVGALVAFATALKLSPIALVGWCRISRSRGALSWFAAGGVVVGLAVLVFAGPQSVLDFPSSISTVRPSVLSLSGLTGVSWLSMAVLIGGTLLAALIRSEGLSFGIAVVVAVIGTPVLFKPGLVPLIALLAPLADWTGWVRWWVPATARRSARGTPAGR